MMKKVLLVSLCTFIFNYSIYASHLNEQFHIWLNDLKIELHQSGYTHEFLEETFFGVNYNPKIIEYDRSQPEFVRSIGSYLNLVISNTRYTRGRALLRRNRALFDSIQEQFGVSGNFLTSFWALETNFSDHTGKIDLVEALATLSFDKRRSHYFKKELKQLLIILSNDKIYFPGQRIQGSWAGAMGSTQFMPSNINAYALDYDRDGIINMWSNQSDFLASSANFLKQIGWEDNNRCVLSIELDHDFNYLESGLHIKKSIKQWESEGVTLLKNSLDEMNFDDSMMASVYLPQGESGPKLLMLPNFFTTFKWNNSTKYALGICLLQELYRGNNILGDFNLEEESFLSFELTKKLQRRLNELGHDAGSVDGIIGPKTLGAVQRYQFSHGLTPDGYLTQSLLESILRIE